MLRIWPPSIPVCHCGWDVSQWVCSEWHPGVISITLHWGGGYISLHVSSDKLGRLGHQRHIGPCCKPCVLTKGYTNLVNRNSITDTLYWDHMECPDWRGVLILQVVLYTSQDNRQCPDWRGALISQVFRFHILSSVLGCIGCIWYLVTWKGHWYITWCFVWELLSMYSILVLIPRS